MTENSQEYIVIETKEVRESIPELKNWNTITYILYALGYFLGGLPWIIAVVMNYLKKGDSVGTIYESHTDWQIRTFWWGLIWLTLGGLTFVFIIGIPILLANFVWVIYRVVKGFMRLGENRPAYDD